jgi:uncharacterized protein
MARLADPGASQRGGILRRHDLVVFVLLALALTWAVWIPRALGADVGVLGPLSTWMPAVAAVICAAWLRGRAGLADLGRRLVRWRVGWVWYVVIILAPLLFSLAAAGVAVLLGQSWATVQPIVLTMSVPAILITFVLLVLTDGLGEEVGWRGYALPRLLERHGPIAASLILGVIWWVWHLPLVWTSGAALEGDPVWLLLADLLAKSLLFTWVFLRTSGSVLVAIMLHASTNLFAVSPVPASDGDLTLSLVALALKWVLVAVLFVVGSLRRRPSPAAAGHRSPEQS